MQRFWLCMVNRRLREDECITRKTQAAESLLAIMEPWQTSVCEKRFPPQPSRIASVEVSAALPPAVTVGELTARQQYNKLIGEIAILRDLRREADLLAQPFDALALKKQWSSPLLRRAPSAAVASNIEGAGASSDSGEGSGAPSKAAASEGAMEVEVAIGEGASSDSDDDSGSESDSEADSEADF